VVILQANIWGSDVYHGWFVLNLVIVTACCLLTHCGCYTLNVICINDIPVSSCRILIWVTLGSLVIVLRTLLVKVCDVLKEVCVA